MSTPAGSPYPTARPSPRPYAEQHHCRPVHPDDFVIADAKDADMAFWVTSAGPIADAPTGTAGLVTTRLPRFIACIVVICTTFNNIAGRGTDWVTFNIKLSKTIRFTP
jgi:hypothetical protein